LRLGVVAPAWDMAAGALFRQLVPQGWNPVWISTQGFAQSSSGEIVHEDLKTPFDSFDGVFALSLCDASDVEMFGWRLGILQELALAGVRVEPDPFRLETVWNPARMLLRLRRSGLPVVPSYLGESLEDAVAFAKEDGCIHRTARGEVDPVLTRIEPGDGCRAKLVELWQNSPEGPFLLLRPPDGLFLTVLCLTGEALGAISWNLAPATDRRAPKAQLREDEFELATKAAALFCLSVCGVDLVRTDERTYLLGVRAHGVLEAFGAGHPRFGQWLPEALTRLFVPAADGQEGSTT
jgi:hypothetical protein